MSAAETQQEKVKLRCPECGEGETHFAECGVLECESCDHKEDDQTVLLEYNEDNPPEGYDALPGYWSQNFCELENSPVSYGCCVDDVLVLGSTDKKGLQSVDLYVCMGCGKQSESPFENDTSD